MPRLRRWYAVAWFVVLAPFLTASAPAPPVAPKAEEKPTAEKWLLDRALTVTPKSASVPALKYRLFPQSMDRKEGNAVPIYLRFAHERSDAMKRETFDKPAKWLELPLDKLPRDEIKEFLRGRSYMLRQLDLGARRKTADWNYTLDKGGGVTDILLPDVQEMRGIARVLAVKAKVEIVEGKYEDAVHTLETGFSFSQQLADAPFLISDLVGIATANQYADCVLDLAERPDAPNLYWALTVLPQPLIDLRRGMEFEQRLLEYQFPELADLDRPRTPEQWDAVLRDYRTELRRILGPEFGTKPPLGPSPDPAEPAAKSKDLPAAKKYLIERAGLKESAVNAMPPAQVLLLYVTKYSRELSEDRFKLAYLPYPQARPRLAEADRRLKNAPATEGTYFARALLPSTGKVQLAQARLDRTIAALRVVEALRMHAAANEGQLPAKLADVKVVPVPDDPATGKPFAYQRDGATATVISRIPDEPVEFTGLRLRVTVRR